MLVLLYGRIIWTLTNVARCWAFFSLDVGVSECQSEDSFICFGAKPTQRACVRDFSHDWKKTREGKVPERTEESRGQDRRRQSVGESSQQKLGKLTVRERRLLGPVDPEAELANMRGWVSIPGSFCSNTCLR